MPILGNQHVNRVWTTLFYALPSATSLNAAGTRAASLKLGRSYRERSEDDLLHAHVLALRYGHSDLAGRGLRRGIDR